MSDEPKLRRRRGGGFYALILFLLFFGAYVTSYFVLSKEFQSTQFTGIVVVREFSSREVCNHYRAFRWCESVIRGIPVAFICAADPSDPVAEQVWIEHRKYWQTGLEPP